MKPLWIALSMYSRLPAPKTEWTEDGMKYALCFFPVVGLIEGVLFVGAWQLCQWLSVGTLFQAAVLTALPVLVTGGIHMDGFLDTMDALSSWQPRERKLEILKDSHTGAFAVIGGSLYVLLYAGGVSEIRQFSAACLVGGGFVLSRILSALSLCYFKNAKKEGLAYAFMSAAHKRVTRTVLSAELAVTVGGLAVAGGAVAVPGSLAVPSGGLAAGMAGAAPVLAMLGAAGAAWGYYWRMSSRQFGGITGDLAGFFLQVCELAMLYGIVTAGRL